MIIIFTNWWANVCGVHSVPKTQSEKDDQTAAAIAGVCSSGYSSFRKKHKMNAWFFLFIYQFSTLNLVDESLESLLSDSLLHFFFFFA